MWKIIGKSLSSLLIQTYRKLQVIIIDDGSTDNSGEICDYYGANDGRIEVYHIQNAGVSNARNQGLNYAKGKYIYFLIRMIPLSRMRFGRSINK